MQFKKNTVLTRLIQMMAIIAAARPEVVFNLAQGTGAPNFKALPGKKSLKKLVSGKQ